LGATVGIAHAHGQGAIECILKGKSGVETLVAAGGDLAGLIFDDGGLVVRADW
jgi:hypothetical protein